jgi:acetyltransferase
MPDKSLDKIFNPKSIAVVGATDNKGHVGYSIMKNLLSGKYKGAIYPINIKHPTVQGVKAYASVLNVNKKIDLVVIATPAITVPGVVEECGKAGISGIVIISAGFLEVGEQGKALVKTILETAKKYNMRIIGPNCLGFIRPSLNLNASFSQAMALPGKIAFISQSGALCTAILDWSIKQNVGFSYFVSIGSMIDVSFHDLIDYIGNDPETNSIVLYMESLTDARKFLSAARAFSRNKPLIILKVGKSSEGAKAALSHTGSIAGNDIVFDAAFKRAGAVRVNTIGELFDCAKTLAMQKRPAGNRLLILTNAGGPGVIATDYLIDKGGALAKLAPETIQKLNEILPASWSHGNPVDIIGDADAERYRKAIEISIADSSVDGILIILTPQEMTDAAAVASAIVNLPNPTQKTLLASWMGEDMVAEGRDILEKGNIPVYRVPENAIRCFMNMYNYSKNLELLYETPATIPHAFAPKTYANKILIDNVIKEGRFTLTESEAKQLLANYDIPVTRNAIARNAEEAVKFSKQIGFPVVMKIASSYILHKTEVGGVKLNIKSSDEALQAFTQIIESVKKHAPEAKIEGVLIEQMVSKKYELLIGSKKDPVFGPVIVFGMGGVAVEIYKDTKVGLPPLNMALAKRLMEETKIYTLLKGYRNMPGVDVTSIQFLLYKFAYLVADFPLIKEIDINPFGVDEKGGIVLDAKVILDKDLAGKEIKPYSHLVISPYPKEYETRFKLHNKKEVLLRPIRPEDEPMEAEMFTTLSEQTQKFRFFKTIKDITHELLIRYTQIDYDREIAVIAELNDNGKKKMIGVVRLVIEPDNENAEFSVMVSDPYQNQGLGNKFTDYIIEIARKREVKRIYAVFLKENEAMLSMFKKRKFKISEQNGNYFAELQLR